MFRSLYRSSCLTFKTIQGRPHRVKPSYRGFKQSVILSKTLRNTFLQCILTLVLVAAPPKDVAKINEAKQPLYQDDTNKRILSALDLLNGLDDDAVEAKRLQHPQAEMIEQE